MHRSNQQRIEVLGALQARASQARAEFYNKVGLQPPAKPIRYQVVSKGPKAFHIVERTTGKTRAFRFTYKEAIAFAQYLEARAEGAVLTLAGERQ